MSMRLPPPQVRHKPVVKEIKLFDGYESDSVEIQSESPTDDLIHPTRKAVAEFGRYETCLLYLAMVVLSIILTIVFVYVLNH